MFKILHRIVKDKPNKIVEEKCVVNSYKKPMQLLKTIYEKADF
jgi:hypothetical protein